MRNRTIIYLSMFILSILPASFVQAQSGWFTPLNFGLIPANPPTSVRYDDIFFISHDTGVLVSSYGMLFKTYDGAEHWELKKAITAGTYFRSVEFTSNGQVGIAGTVTGQVYRSADRGETWNDISFNISDTGASAKDICGLAHYGNTIFGVGWWGARTARFYKSTDAGISWTTRYIDTNLASGLVDITFLSANKGFITGYHYYGLRNQESIVLRTLDGGDTWTKVFSDTTIGGGVWKIQFIDSEYGVGSIEPMYTDTVAMIKTTDGGNTWQLIPVGHVNAWYNGWGTQGIGFLNRQKGWLGGYYNGMFETNDGGLTWDTLNINEECDRFFLVGGTMYVSANTVYKYNSDDSTAKVINAPPPSFVHKLYPVTPNPASSVVRIEFDINEHQTNTVLEVVNTGGRKSYPVMRGYLKPGHYSYKWDGTNAPDGNYIVWLGTDEIPMVQRFMLSK
jgi:photosystem II stability/assembly factor-like uncharacterized protein